MSEDLDADTLAVLCVLGEIELQCQWARDHLDAARSNIERMFATKIPPFVNFPKWRAYESATFREIQSFLTCASIANSLLTGKGIPRQRGLVGATPAQRRAIQEGLGLPAGFKIEGGPQRNALIHIEERLIAWSKPGGLRGSAYVSPGRLSLPSGDRPLEQQPLRALGKEPFEFAVLGEVCNLSQIEASLKALLVSSVATHQRILDAINAGRETSAAK